MKPLYAIKDEYLKALDELPELDLQDDVIKDTLEGIRGTFEEKAISISAYIKNIEAEKKAIADTTKTLADRKKAIENKVERLKGYLKTNMEACDIKKIHDPLLDVMIRNNPPKVNIFDESIVPNDFVRVVKEIDKALVKEALKDGIFVPGCTLVQEKSLIIK